MPFDRAGVGVEVPCEAKADTLCGKKFNSTEQMKALSAAPIDFQQMN